MSADPARWAFRLRLATLIAEATAEEKRITSEINTKAQQELAAIKEKVAKEAGEARAALGKEVDTFAQAIGEKILGRVIG